MKAINTNFKLRSLATAFLLAFLIGFSGTAVPVFAHGGEDHGDEKPKTATTTTGTISRTSRLGDFEIMLKHPLLEPDMATTARLFITKFTTNEPVGDANPAVEIESASGTVTEIAVEKTESVGSYIVKIPALPAGAYAIRTKATVSGKTNTATFSGVEVKPQAIAADNSRSGMSWARTILITFIFLIVLALFGGLIYFVLRFSEGNPITEDTVSA